MPECLAPVLGPRLAAPILATAKRLLGGVSDEAIAEDIGFDRSLIGHWRSGARAMPVEVLVTLCESTGDPAALLRPLLVRCGLEVVGTVSSTEAPASVLERQAPAVAHFVGWALSALADGHLSPEEIRSSPLSSEQLRELADAMDRAEAGALREVR